MRKLAEYRDDLMAVDRADRRGNPFRQSPAVEAASEITTQTAHLCGGDGGS
ncbi:hypothetical protein [Streptomyces abikoensis]|uniref:hypothetical protein n=1 Tax=Streptomyces abikoensis TaxID=97398 RepID=UPI0036ABD445